MAKPRYTVAMIDAETATKKALARAVAEHEAQVAAQEHAAVGGYLGRYKPFPAGLATTPPPAQATPNITPQAPLTPDQQGIVDAFWDENDRWAGRDESGKPVATATRIDWPVMGRGLARDVANVEADDARRAAEAAKITARSNLARRV